jgi:FdhD protein
MSEPPLRSVAVRVRQVRGTRSLSVSDVVAVEEPLEIRVVPSGSPPGGWTRIAVTMRTPGNDLELAAGFLFTEGIIDGPASIARVEFAPDVPGESLGNVVNVHLATDAWFDPTLSTRSFYTTSSCGICGKGSLEALYVQGCRRLDADSVLVPDLVLRALPDKLRSAQAVFDETGGLHAAGLFSAEGNLSTVREDVGRHNAVDKVIGERLRAGDVPLRGRLLLVSGRASFEIVQKAAVAGIPIVAAVGAPSSLAVETAQEFGMTLIGFLRRDGFNVYTVGQRIAPPAAVEAP